MVDWLEDWDTGQLYGIMKVLVQAKSKDKKMMKEDLSVTLGQEMAHFIPHVNPPRGDVRVFIMNSLIEAETLMLSLRGANVKIAIPSEARVIMSSIALTDRFESLQVPEGLERILTVSLDRRKSEE